MGNTERAANNNDINQKGIKRKNKKRKKGSIKEKKLFNNNLEDIKTQSVHSVFAEPLM